jgi:hypothetical protein
MPEGRCGKKKNRKGRMALLRFRYDGTLAANREPSDGMQSLATQSEELRSPSLQGPGHFHSYYEASWVLCKVAFSW